MPSSQPRSRGLKDLPARFRRWVSGSIRRKLTLFVLLVCLLLIGLVWVFAVQLLEPAYNAALHKDLTRKLDVFAAVLDKACDDGLDVVTDYQVGEGVSVRTLSVECVDLLNDEIVAGRLSIAGICVDIAQPDLQSVFVRDPDPVAQCVLHNSEGLLNDEAAGRNGNLVMTLRAVVFQEGALYRATSTQMIVGTTAAGGSVSLILSTNLERISQAVSVLRGLMLPTCLVLVLVSVFCAFLFSHWFTRPITRLSAATKEIVKGNYGVRVKETGGDEIANLTHDFNEMAREVGRSVKLQKDILANVSHDLRTPLTLIKGYAETVRDLTGDEPEKRTEQLNVIVDESDRLSELVGSVMELSRMSSGNEKPNPVRFDLAQLCEEMGYRYVALSAQQGYHFELSADEACDIYADPGLVERALHNLLGNALSHVGEDGYIGLSARKTPKGTARVEVSDHGPGISDADLPHLFDRYYRSRSDAGKPGSGLGLSIVKAIFEASGFTYGVESRQGEGATFWFEAPLAVGEKVPPHEPGAG